MTLKRKYQKKPKTADQALMIGSAASHGWVDDSSAIVNDSNNRNDDGDDNQTVQTTASQRSLKQRLKVVGRPFKPLRKFARGVTGKIKKKNKVQATMAGGRKNSIPPMTSPTATKMSVVLIPNEISSTTASNESNALKPAIVVVATEQESNASVASTKDEEVPKPTTMVTKDVASAPPSPPRRAKKIDFAGQVHVIDDSCFSPPTFETMGVNLSAAHRDEDHLVIADQSTAKSKKEATTGKSSVAATVDAVTVDADQTTPETAKDHTESFLVQACSRTKPYHRHLMVCVLAWAFLGTLGLVVATGLFVACHKREGDHKNMVKKNQTN